MAKELAVKLLAASIVTAVIPVLAVETAPVTLAAPVEDIAREVAPAAVRATAPVPTVPPE
jgi:hypothetical protein